MKRPDYEIDLLDEIQQEELGRLSPQQASKILFYIAQTENKFLKSNRIAIEATLHLINAPDIQNCNTPGYVKWKKEIDKWLDAPVSKRGER